MVSFQVNAGSSLSFILMQKTQRSFSKPILLLLLLSLTFSAAHTRQSTSEASACLPGLEVRNAPEQCCR
jgi:hypothetical protein